jgi:hypothetical protein
LAPHLAELHRAPVPPMRPPPDLAERISACQAVSLLTISQVGPQRRFFVHRRTATELEAEQPDGSPAAAFVWEVEALVIIFRLRVTQAEKTCAALRRTEGSLALNGSPACCLRPRAIPA